MTGAIVGRESASFTRRRARRRQVLGPRYRVRNPRTLLGVAKANCLQIQRVGIASIAQADNVATGIPKVEIVDHGKGACSAEV